MRTDIPEKLLKIAHDIKANGQANLTRLTVLKKWFERPERLIAFAVWTAARAASGKGKTGVEAAQLFAESRALLKRTPSFTLRASVDRRAATRLHDRLREFQNEFEYQRWGPVRIIKNWNLLIVEKALAICLNGGKSPAEGYRLAAAIAGITIRATVKR
jgi:hypothetical protein